MSRKDCTVFCKAAWENGRGRELFSTKASVCCKVQHKIWHLVSCLYLPGILPHVHKGRLVGYSLAPWFWSSDESADSFLLTHSASFGFLVLLSHLQISLRVTVVRGTVQGAEKKQRVAHTGISHFWLRMSSDTAEVLGELTWLVFSWLPLRCSQRKKTKFVRTQLPCEALPLCVFAHVLSSIIFLLQVKLYQKYWARMTLTVGTLM